MIFDHFTKLSRPTKVTRDKMTKYLRKKNNNNFDYVAEPEKFLEERISANFYTI